MRLQWTGSSEELRIFFVADAVEDASLVVNLPDGTWVCNDDSPLNLTIDPLIVLSDPLEGQYDIWVGTFEDGGWIPGELNITELDLEP